MPVCVKLKGWTGTAAWKLSPHDQRLTIVSELSNKRTLGFLNTFFGHRALLLAHSVGKDAGESIRRGRERICQLEGYRSPATRHIDSESGDQYSRQTNFFKHSFHCIFLTHRIVSLSRLVSREDTSSTLYLTLSILLVVFPTFCVEPFVTKPILRNYFWSQEKFSW